MKRYPKAKWLPVPNHSSAMTGHLGLILHVQEGTGSLHGYFSNPKVQASSTFWVSKTGAVEQYVDGDVVAWAQMAGNHAYNSVETEGHHSEALTAAQVNALAELYVWGHLTYGWPLTLAEKPGQHGFGWHGMGGGAWGGHTGCPGDRRKAQRAAVLAIAKRALTPPAKPAKKVAVKKPAAVKPPAAVAPAPQPGLSPDDVGLLKAILAFFRQLFGKAPA